MEDGTRYEANSGVPGQLMPLEGVEKLTFTKALLGPGDAVLSGGPSLLLYQFLPYHNYYALRKRRVGFAFH